MSNAETPTIKIHKRELKVLLNIAKAGQENRGLYRIGYNLTGTMCATDGKCALWRVNKMSETSSTEGEGPLVASFPWEIDVEGATKAIALATVTNTPLIEVAPIIREIHPPLSFPPVNKVFPSERAACASIRVQPSYLAPLVALGAALTPRGRRRRPVVSVKIEHTGEGSSEPLVATLEDDQAIWTYVLMPVRI